MAENKTLTKTVTVRLPDEVYKALEKKTKDKQKEFPRYREADALRSALVNDLKAKGYLKKDQNYLY